MHLVHGSGVSPLVAGYYPTGPLPMCGMNDYRVGPQDREKIAAEIFTHVEYEIVIIQQNLCAMNAARLGSASTCWCRKSRACSYVSSSAPPRFQLVVEIYSREVRGVGVQDGDSAADPPCLWREAEKKGQVNRWHGS